MNTATARAFSSALSANVSLGLGHVRRAGKLVQPGQADGKLRRGENAPQFDHLVGILGGQHEPEGARVPHVR